MRNNILTIMRKELTRFFTDRRLVLSVLVLPGLMIYLLYSFMGSAMGDLFSAEEDYTPLVHMIHAPESVSFMAEEAGMLVSRNNPEEKEMLLSLVETKQADLLAVFPEDFEAQIAAYIPGQGAAANIELYYNAASPESSEAYSLFFSLLDAYEDTLANKFDINREVQSNLATEKDAAGLTFSSMLPLLLMVFLFSGCVSVAPESIAGEKERGSIATLLVTPMGRGQLAVGKVLSLGIIALLSGASSFLGTMLSLPKLMGEAAAMLDASVYSATDYAMLFLVIASTVLVLVSMIAVLSAFAKTVKEASTMVMPLMIVNMLIGVSAMFGSAQTDAFWYCIPLYNSVQCMSAIFAFRMDVSCILITLAVNLAFAALMTVILRRLFNSEAVMFSR